MDNQTQKIIIGGIAAMAILLVIKSFFKKDKKNDAEKQREKILKELNDSVTSGETVAPTISTSQAEVIAQGQLDAMAWFGTDSIDSMTLPLKKLNGTDLILVYDAFGLNRYFGAGRSSYLGTDLDLFGWYKEELDNEELNKMRSVWAKSKLPF